MPTSHSGNTPRKVNRRVARWFAELQDYDFEIKTPQERTHTAADFLSRPFTDDKGEQDNEDIGSTPPRNSLSTARSKSSTSTPFSEISTRQSLRPQKHYPLCMKAWAERSRDNRHQHVRPPYGEIPGWRKEGKLVVPPNLSLKRTIMYHVHDALKKHPNQAKHPTTRPQCYYWWPDMKDWIEKSSQTTASHVTTPSQQSSNHERANPRYDPKILRTQQRDATPSKAGAPQQSDTEDRSLWMKDEKIAIPTDEPSAEKSYKCYTTHLLPDTLDGIETFVQVSREYWWPGMRTWISDYVAGCANVSAKQEQLHIGSAPPLYRIPTAEDALTPSNRSR